MRYQITPVPKPRMTRRDQWGTNKRPIVAKYHDFKDEVRAAGIALEDKIFVEFYIPMPKSWSKKKKNEMFCQPHKQKPDLDNLIKALLDACMMEDCTVWNIQARKYWHHEGGIVVHEVR